MALPVARRAEEVVERIAESGTVVVVGETGSGKTTQLGQALLDANAAGDGAVAVTQPRRVATVSVANRVARERGQEIGGEVGYTVRFEDRTSEHTRMRFLTDGALLRELLRDPWLRAFGAIVLDEAHERSLNTDILFALCKKLSSERSPPLRLLVTSATLDGSKFSAFFSNAPIVSIPGRAFDIDIAYTTQTPTSYIDAALDATLQVHCSHPVPGDILVFMPGQDDIDRLVRKLNDAVASMDEADCPDAQVLPLHAALPPEMQARVFSDPPTNVRRIVVSTNIAETSVTVPGIVHVVDPGKVKRKEYDPSTGMESLAVEDISRTEAIQRAGRAGRTQPGKCYRLYTKELFENRMKSTAKPEIQRSSLAATVLHLKVLSLGIDVLSFDFLDPPPREALEDALRQLYIVDAIDIGALLTSLHLLSAFSLSFCPSPTLLSLKHFVCDRWECD
jgi:ATP-dependent RNA helicase DHX8/PRP22